MSSEIEKIKCFIIGSGPAGYTAALYAARANMNPVLYQGLQPGGQLTITTDVENYPGYPEGIMGPEMMEDLRKQAERFGTDIRIGYVSNVDFQSGPPFKLTIDEKLEIEAETVIISTGATALYLGLESELRLNGYGVSACAVCDGFFYKGQDVAVVGAGDSACEEASYLSNICSKVTMLIRRDAMRASKIMQDRVNKIKNIEILWNTETVEVLGDKNVEGVKIINNKTNEESVLDVTGFFLAIGHKPNTGIFNGQLDMDDKGYIVTKPDSSLTNIPGVFASGDVQDTVYRQAVTAAGTGCMAALDAERYLAAKETES
ncbi:MAG: thioredoxin-disulfide reductase [Bacteroidetes bacterium]|nr:MAG: thioredoxin-disulfide reductase [Bacteroidota bacterium]